jgi:competence protein ComFC
MAWLSDAIEILLSLFFPRLCLACGRELDVFRTERYPVCEDCTSRLSPISGSRCVVCSANLISETKICTRCRETAYSFESCTSLFEYGGLMKELIYQYKFGARKSLALLFAKLLGDALCALHEGLTVVPVPSSRKSSRKRGWDHMKEVTDRIKNNYAVSVCDVLERTTDIPQKELSFSARRENLKGKIAFNRARVSSCPDYVVLMDDVFTTGATCDECARVLMENGARKVYVMTLAIN